MHCVHAPRLKEEENSRVHMLLVSTNAVHLRHCVADHNADILLSSDWAFTVQSLVYFVKKGVLTAWLIVAAAAAAAAAASIYCCRSAPC
jgi:hypothetical protein